MKSKSAEIIEELKSVLGGKTLDAMIPTILFVIINGVSNLNIAIISAIVIAILIGIMRILRKQTWSYAFFGLLGVLFASGFAYFAQNASNYFIPSIINSVLILSGALISLIFDKPIAAFASHLTRGWPLPWFWRKDVKPAYREVTYLWLIYFLFRAILQVTLYIQTDVNQLVWINTLTGLPVLIVVLVLSYIYGVWRLKNLKGPGVDEFIENKEPPFKGQTRGF